jgi:hypothetical protein
MAAVFGRWLAMWRTRRAMRAWARFAQGAALQQAQYQAQRSRWTDVQLRLRTEQTMARLRLLGREPPPGLTQRELEMLLEEVLLRHRQAAWEAMQEQEEGEKAEAQSHRRETRTVVEGSAVPVREQAAQAPVAQARHPHPVAASPPAHSPAAPPDPPASAAPVSVPAPAASAYSDPG